MAPSFPPKSSRGMLSPAITLTSNSKHCHVSFALPVNPCYSFRTAVRHEKNHPTPRRRLLPARGDLRCEVFSVDKRDPINLSCQLATCSILEVKHTSESYTSLIRLSQTWEIANLRHGLCTSWRPGNPAGASNPDLHTRHGAVRQSLQTFLHGLAPRYVARHSDHGGPWLWFTRSMQSFLPTCA